MNSVLLVTKHDQHEEVRDCIIDNAYSGASSGCVKPGSGVAHIIVSILYPDATRESTPKLSR